MSAPAKPERKPNEVILYENASQRLSLFRWEEDGWSITVGHFLGGQRERYLTRAEVLEIVERLVAALE